MFLRGRGGAPVETFANVSTGAYGANVSTGPRCGPPAKHFRKSAPVETFTFTRGRCFYGGSPGTVETFFVSTGGGRAENSQKSENVSTEARWTPVETFPRGRRGNILRGAAILDPWKHFLRFRGSAGCAFRTPPGRLGPTRDSRRRKVPSFIVSSFKFYSFQF